MPWVSSLGSALITFWLLLQICHCFCFLKKTATKKRSLGWCSRWLKSPQYSFCSLLHWVKPIKCRSNSSCFLKSSIHIDQCKSFHDWWYQHTGTKHGDTLYLTPAQWNSIEIVADFGDLFFCLLLSSGCCLSGARCRRPGAGNKLTSSGARRYTAVAAQYFSLLRGLTPWGRSMMCY